MATSTNCLCVQNSISLCVQVYLILDEFILGGEIQESSKRVILERLAGGGCLQALIAELAAVHVCAHASPEIGGSLVLRCISLLWSHAELDKIET